MDALRRISLICGLLVLSVGCGGDLPPDDTPSDGLDAGVRAARPSVADAGSVAAEAPPAEPTPEDRLRNEIAALRQLLAGELTSDFDPQALFLVDLSDPRACQARVEVLRAELRLPVVVVDAGFGAPDAAPPPDGGRDGSLEVGGLDAGSALATAATDAGPLDAGDAGSLDGGAAAGVDAGPPPQDLDEVARLERQRDELRLQFLRLPSEERASRLEAVRARRRITAEEEASVAAAIRARRDEQRAVEARQDALDRVAASASAIQRDLLTERARVEAAKVELARWQAVLAERRARVAHRSAERLELAHALDLAIASGLERDEADTQYALLVAVLEDDRTTLDLALDALAAPSEVPTFEPNIDAHESHYRPFEERGQLLEAVDRYEAERAQVVSSEEDFRWTSAERVASDLRRLDALRVQLFPLMSRAERETYLGLGSEGRAQFARELNQARLMARHWSVQTLHELPTYPRSIGRLLARTTTRNELLLVVALLVGLTMGYRRRERVTEWLRRRIHRTGADRRWMALVRPLWAVLGSVTVNLVLIAGLYLIFALLSTLTDSIVLLLIRTVVLSVAWFGVLVTATSGYFVSRLRHRAARAKTARRIFGSVRLVLGFGLVVVLMLRLSELLLGKGYLHGIVVDFAWLGGIPLGLILIREWADDVAEELQTKYPTGFLARRLSAKDSRLRRYLLTPFGVAQLAVAGLTSSFKELALRFDQARRAFAFLFRRRLEKQAEATASEVDLRVLPKRLVDAFSGQSLDDELDLDFFPGLDEAVERVRTWQSGGSGFAVALVGERGLGKTSWMRHLMKRTELDALLLSVPHDLTQPALFCRWLGEQLGVEDSRSVDELARHILDEDVRGAVFLDHCQNMVVRAIGGTVALETLVELAARTSSRMIWVCSFSRFTWKYLERARQAQDLFSDRVVLEPWPEEKIAAVVHHRMEAVGMRASFRDLVVGPVAGSELELAVLRTEGEYLRLLWDYAEGNPRVALHFWLHSLVVQGEELRVRLFEAPDPDTLDALHEQSRFLLAAVVLHENVSDQEAAITTGMNSRQCSALLAYLGQLGYVEVDDLGHWRVTTHWYRAVIRYLRRKRLLFE